MKIGIRSFYTTRRVLKSIDCLVLRIFQRLLQVEELAFLMGSIVT